MSIKTNLTHLIALAVAFPRRQEQERYTQADHIAHLRADVSAAKRLWAKWLLTADIATRWAVAAMTRVETQTDSIKRLRRQLEIKNEDYRVCLKNLVNVGVDWQDAAAWAVAAMTRTERLEQSLDAAGGICAQLQAQIEQHERALKRAQGIASMADRKRMVAEDDLASLKAQLAEAPTVSASTVPLPLAHHVRRRRVAIAVDTLAEATVPSNGKRECIDMLTAAARDAVAGLTSAERHDALIQSLVRLYGAHWDGKEVWTPSFWATIRFEQERLS